MAQSIKKIPSKVVEDEPVDEATIGHNSAGSHAEAAEKIKQLVAKVERLEEDKKGIADDIKDVYAEAKSMGYDVKALRAAVRLRKQDKQELEEFESVLETYLIALDFYD